MLSTGTQQYTTKKFLSGKPSLYDIISVAPEWEDAFKSVHESLQERDEQMRQYKDLLSDSLKLSNHCKSSIQDKHKITLSHLSIQTQLLAYLDEQEPILRTIKHYMNTISSTCQRLRHYKDKTTTNMILIPHPDNARFIDYLQQQSDQLQKKADILCMNLTTLNKILSSEKSNTFEQDLKDNLSLFLSHYKHLYLSVNQLKEQFHQIFNKYQTILPNLEQQLEEAVRDVHEISTMSYD